MVLVWVGFFLIIALLLAIDLGVVHKKSHAITMPEATPYVSSPEPFVHNGKSWLGFTLSSDPNGRNFTQPSLVAIAGIVPGVEDLRLLTSADDPPRVRRDPEYFITAKGPYIYYNRYVPQTETTPPISEGVYRVDTGLGPCTTCAGAAAPGAAGR